jgi:DNA modification methylase
VDVDTGTMSRRRPDLRRRQHIREGPHGGALAAHPTVKPVALVADALLDCTAGGDVVLDQFVGSGTTILAAEKVARVAVGIEYERRDVDVAILRGSG